MTTFGRIVRKLFFAGVFLFFIIGFSYSIYQKYFPALPTCTDSIQNQDETGIDCGGICETECPPLPPPDSVMPIKVDWAKAIYNDVGVYDLAAKITNPNKYWGIAETSYQFIVRDSNDIVIFEQSGKTYILPDSYDYLIITSKKINGLPAKMELDIIKEGQKWASVSDIYNSFSLSLPFREKVYTVKDENGFPSASAILKNATNYDFDKIDIKVVLYDKNGEPVAVNVSDRRTMRSGEEQYFRLIWNFPPQKEVVNPEFKATTNIFDSQNFMRRFGTDDKVKEYR